jgi:hypothetical protein
MNRWLASAILLALAPAACARNYSAEELHRTVQPHPNREGVYLVYYRYMEMIEEYGPGVERVRELASQAQSANSKQAVWDEALAIAVPRYLESRNLVPEACTNGILVISSHGDEAGGGTTAFRCK